MHILYILQSAFLKHRILFLCLSLVLLLLSSSPYKANASIPNHIYRVDVRPHKGFTRVTLRFEETPRYSVSIIPGNRLRVVIEDTAGTLFKKFRGYSDKNMGGVVIKKRGNNLLVTFQMSEKSGWRDLTRPEVSAITIDVGAVFKQEDYQRSLPGRERIRKGVEKLVRDFDPPLKSEIPFTQTDREILKRFLADDDQKTFMAAEAALYKGRLTEAEELFVSFSARQTSIRPLALYRLAETWYKLQKYPQALVAFREAEKLWPDYLRINPGVTFYYGDSIARGGELLTARTLLAELVARLADKTYAPALLVRLGDILTRQGHGNEALAIYKNVAENFKENKASQMALMRFADNGFLETTPWNYRSISDIYLTASMNSGDLDMREEAHFKHILLESIHGEAGEALQFVMGFERKFPRGVYVAVTRTIREVLVAEVFRATDWKKGAAALVRFMESQNEYLAICVQQPGFLEAVTLAYNESGRPIELVKLLSAIVERSWATALAPELYLSVAENAELIGDSKTAEEAIRTFLSKYSANPNAGLMRERLGSIYYVAGNYQKARDTLLWLLNKKEHATQLKSYYQLGRALYELRQFSQASKSMDLFISAASDRQSTLLPDAYFVAASARDNYGDKKGAILLFEEALKLPDNPRNEEFIYRTGEVNFKAGNTARAEMLFRQLAKNGKDADWRRLAQQALLNIK
ncbi:MAG: tetratricopeptide repeat protein [Desulfuromonadaceae bacterium]|nr:tetratricopeptide repeat protein [Desulfuromonadaceae bacterium]MDD2855535.1 tetratricopeptide repeat protein [Desulfuromonadaceae bacterium]